MINEENKNLTEYLSLLEKFMNNEINEFDTTHPLLLLLLFDHKNIKASKEIINTLNEISYPKKIEKINSIYNKDFILTPIFKLSIKENIDILDLTSWNFFDEFANNVIGISKEELQKTIATAYSEVLNNIKDHSRSDEGLIMFRYKKKVIDITFYDFGVGFKKSLSEKKYETEKDALIAGYINHVSSKPEFGRGWGLEHIKNSIIRNGELIIISNNCFLYANTDKELLVKELNFNIKGTCVSLRYYF